MSSTIVILDFGSQYTQLIARRVRQLGVFSLILPYQTSLDEVQSHHPVGLILSGGPSSVTLPSSPRCDPALLSGEIPVLGICYGMQLLCHEFKGKVIPEDGREYGRSEISVCPISSGESVLFQGLPDRQTVWMSHGDRAVSLPDDFQMTASVSNGEQGLICVAFQDEKARRFGLQFHPEVSHTDHGEKILSNFIFKVCDCKKDWTPKGFVEQCLEEIRGKVGNEKVVLGVSGGVDSSVAACLIHKAIGEQLIPVFIDNGLLRASEREEVAARFEKDFHIHLHVHDARCEFLSALKGLEDPEEKRKAIGKTFIESFTKVLREIVKEDAVRFLAQGTLYPDMIESSAVKGGPSVTIKTHHNVGGLPKDLKFDLLEPLKWLFKDDVRRVGSELGLEGETLSRHPFPGPGLAVRILGEITEEKLDTLRKADEIFMKELRSSGWYDKVSQAFVVFLPVKTVGVMGDARTYENVAALRAVVTTDFMTADWAPLPYELLARVSNRICNEVRGFNRVVYDISSKPPATIEWE